MRENVLKQCHKSNFEKIQFFLLHCIDCQLRMRDLYTNPYESSNLRFLFARNESTKRIFQKRIHETNPRYESLGFGFTNPNLKDS